MPIDLRIDPLSLELHEQQIEVPVDADDPAKGTVVVTVRELPYAIAKGIQYRDLACSQSFGKTQPVFAQLKSGAPVDPRDMDRLGLAFAERRAAQAEIVRWGICGHRADDFRVKGTPIPFESVSASLVGTAYQVASPRMIHLYQMANGPSLVDGVSGLFENLAEAVRDFQRGVVRTPQEIWDEARAEREKEEAKAKAEKAVPVSQ